jgi:hypothetical protein
MVALIVKKIDASDRITKQHIQVTPKILAFNAAETLGERAIEVVRHDPSRFISICTGKSVGLGFGEFTPAATRPSIRAAWAARKEGFTQLGLER